MNKEKTIKLTYTNWRGETSTRSIIPMKLFWGKTEWHPEEQWLLQCWDIEKEAERLYAFKDIQKILAS